MAKIRKRLRQWFEDFFLFGGWVDLVEWVLIFLVFAIRIAAVAAVVWWAVQILDAIR